MSSEVTRLHQHHRRVQVSFDDPRFLVLVGNWKFTLIFFYITSVKMYSIVFEMIGRLKKKTRPSFIEPDME